MFVFACVHVSVFICMFLHVPNLFQSVLTLNITLPLMHNRSIPAANEATSATSTHAAKNPHKPIAYTTKNTTTTTTKLCEKGTDKQTDREKHKHAFLYNTKRC